MHTTRRYNCYLALTDHRVNHESIVKLMVFSSVEGFQFCLVYKYVHCKSLKKALAKVDFCS